MFLKRIPYAADLNVHAYRLRAQGLLVDTAVARGDSRAALLEIAKP
jgi:hypothetical protein